MTAVASMAKFAKRRQNLEDALDEQMRRMVRERRKQRNEDLLMKARETGEAVVEEHNSKELVPLPLPRKKPVRKKPKRVRFAKIISEELGAEKKARALEEKLKAETAVLEEKLKAEPAARGRKEKKPKPKMHSCVGEPFKAIKLGRHRQEKWWVLACKHRKYKDLPPWRWVTAEGYKNKNRTFRSPYPPRKMGFVPYNTMAFDSSIAQKFKVN